MSQLKRITNSMLWAAYGDSIGFISELADTKMLKYRTNGIEYIKELSRWTRKLGGKFGVQINLQRGIYSYDTQIILRVCKSINRRG